MNQRWTRTSGKRTRKALQTEHARGSSSMTGHAGEEAQRPQQQQPEADAQGGPLAARSQTAADSHGAGSGAAVAIGAFGAPPSASDMRLSASDVDRERRLHKRAAAVDAIKRTPEYRLAPADRRPATPDPTNLAVSKRRWERSVMEWRAALRRVWEL